jgi:phosphate uptake regulator
MATWETRTTVKGQPEHVLEVLTDPSSARRWSPVGFELEDFDGDRLRSGSRAVLSGKLAGKGVSFDVHVIKASDGQLALRAIGPVEMDVAYDAIAAADGTELAASVAVRSAGGLIGRMLSSATDALLAGGALAIAVQGVAREVERSYAATC